jgi:DNA-binding transcriptional ArsR family regulator
MPSGDDLLHGEDPPPAGDPLWGLSCEVLRALVEDGQRPLGALRDELGQSKERFGLALEALRNAGFVKADRELASATEAGRVALRDHDSWLT